MKYHLPVLLPELVNALHPQPGQIFLDCTLGHGGHTIEILKKGATVFGLDADSSNQQIAIDRIDSLGLSSNFHPLTGNFSQITSIWKKHIHQNLNGLILDLGLSSNQQSGVSRGFSFKDPDSLDMRLNPKTQKLTAEEIINTWDRDQLYQIFTKYAQEKLAKPLAFEIIRERQLSPIKSGLRLGQIIEAYYQKKHYHSLRHPATQIFLALRIVVNQEFESLQKVLNASLKICHPGSTVAIISFHSGEDRIVKQFIVKHQLSSQKITPKYLETKENPLSRSAVLRIFTTS